MNKRSFGTVIAATLVASVFSAGPVRAADPPPTVQIDDPKGDANFINDQDNAYGTPLAGQGDVVLPQSVGNATDLLKVWFTHTPSEISLHFQTNGNPGNLAYDTYFRFSSNAGQGPVANDATRGCLQWVASQNGAAGGYTGETVGTLTDKCNVGTAVEGPLTTEAGPDTTFISTMTFPRNYSPLLADGGVITAPFGVSRVVYVGPLPQAGTAAVVTIDNTKRVSDYDIAASGGPPAVQEPPKNEDPGQKDEAPVKKGCKKKKGKGKKKGCDKGKGPKDEPKSSCEAYVPGDNGA